MDMDWMPCPVMGWIERWSGDSGRSEIPSIRGWLGP